MNIEKYKEILSEGLLLDHYYLLCKISSKQEIPYNERVRGFINLLIKKDYIDADHNLTEKGIDFVQNCEFGEIELSTVHITTNSQIKVVTEEQEGRKDIRNVLITIYANCRERIKYHTGKYQVRARIENKFYSFFPNSTDFFKVANKVITLYKIKDFTLMEKTLIAYIDRCATSNTWLPLFHYYIFKNGSSPLVTDMENPDDNPGTSFKSSQKLI
jgi:hypothetical protein